MVFSTTLTTVFFGGASRWRPEKKHNELSASPRRGVQPSRDSQRMRVRDNILEVPRSLKFSDIVLSIIFSEGDIL